MCVCVCCRCRCLFILGLLFIMLFILTDICKWFGWKRRGTPMVRGVYIINKGNDSLSGKVPRFRPKDILLGWSFLLPFNCQTGPFFLSLSPSRSHNKAPGTEEKQPVKSSKPESALLRQVLPPTLTKPNEIFTSRNPEVQKRRLDFRCVTRLAAERASITAADANIDLSAAGTR